MDSAARIYDMYETMLENILKDPSEPAASLPQDFLKAITDNFSNDRIIGRGGFGEVYKGILRSGKKIAVKKIYDRYHVHKDNSLDELSNVLGIMHPNVVQLIGYCAETKMDTMTHDGGKLIVAEIRSRLLCFEYISNGGLDMYISKEYMDLGWDEIYKIIKGICSGLNALHEENIVHLDLKPQNILMDGNMMPKIVDFGLARLLGENKSKIYTERATGTTGYMAPEYFNGGKISTKADIFSLGVIMIELMTGSRNYPRSVPPYYSYTSYGNTLDTTQAQLEEFSGTVLEKWKKIFQKTLKDASLVEVSTNQLKQLIAIALKCVDSDLNKRPNAADILQIFSRNEAGQSLCDPCCKYSQVRDLVSVQPTELKIHMADPNKLYRSSCLLHLNNNTLGHVAFRILSNTLARHFIWPSFGFVPPGCRYTVAVTMRYQQNPPPSEDLVFTLESTRASDQEIKNVISRHLIYDHDDFFAKAKDKGRQVHEEKLTPVYSNNELEIEIVPLEMSDNYMMDSIDAHPTEPWILIIRRSIIIWDYNTQEMAHLPPRGEQKQVSQLSGRFGGSNKPLVAKFIAQKNWIVVGCSVGYIKVYKYCKQALFSEIKSFKAHEYGDISSLELHQTGPYVLSAVENRNGRRASVWDNPMDKIKMWDWENGWKLICTFNTEKYTYQIKFNPMDVNMFATISGGVKVWNTCSPDSVSELRRTHPACLDFFSRDGAPHMIFAEQSNRRKPTIWDCQNMKCVSTLKEHLADVTVVFSHPELPVLVTGSDDGTIRLWNSSTFSLLGVLNCGLRNVVAITSLKGSRRIAILHFGGLAIAEIDTEQSVAIV
uniref:non-specific serine/threonine protein kinase n=4 Tax=Setaria viridis TaxID=4556 RepID=A0A4U6TRV7_SETVI|nr:uncharacterized protein LOC117866880 isoform X1 [Setaria viridis]XP_034607065.1 uncharacterized protein LOC117866880 isoform X1 [Setaria viridis]XP_034607066.1 uncharacterized protein LOC117866880 isoform X1 [Setaria viridis]TKW00307.1 hypothetical protein SEVIR_8G100500v2 [Setaria viridis]TKW00311.1 hypothetical protein SEVIR_8G100500v2 [Setaria viridis]TKW00314.1 hypothetical protein SEVIR_8G100500v2 [Setaria viridis]